MDRMKITIEQESVDNGAMFIQVYINGNDLPGILNVEEFLAVKQQDVIYNGHSQMMRGIS